MVTLPMLFPATAARIARNRGAALAAAAALAFAVGANAAILLVVGAVLGAGAAPGAAVDVGSLRLLSDAVDIGLTRATMGALVAACLGLAAAGRRAVGQGHAHPALANDLVMLGGVAMSLGMITAVWSLATVMNLADAHAAHTIPDVGVPAGSWLACSIAAGLATVLPGLVRHAAAGARRLLDPVSTVAWSIRAGVAGGVALSMAALLGLGMTVAHGSSGNARASEAPSPSVSGSGLCGGQPCASPSVTRCRGTASRQPDRSRARS